MARPFAGNQRRDGKRCRALAAGRLDEAGRAQQPQQAMNAKYIVACAACFLFLAGAVQAQTPTSGPSRAQTECTVPSAWPVDVLPKVLAKPDPKFNRPDRDRYRGYVMTLRAILCGSGKVTDVVVTQGITRDMDN